MHQYSNEQWPTMVCFVLDTQKCFDTRKESLETRSEADYVPRFCKTVGDNFMLVAPFSSGFQALVAALIKPQPVGSLTVTRPTCESSHECCLYPKLQGARMKLSFDGNFPAQNELAP